MPTSIIIREAVSADIDRLARLHAITWADTYPQVKNPPSFEIRKWQWEEQFQKSRESWFCLVMENEQGDLIGFSKGITEKNGGDLNKFYLLKQYHKQGLGKLLMIHSMQKFMAMGMRNIWVVAEAGNPTCAFYEKMGGTRKEDTGPGVAVYVWRDLPEGLQRISLSVRTR